MLAVRQVLIRETPKFRTAASLFGRIGKWAVRAELIGRPYLILVESWW